MKVDWKDKRSVCEYAKQLNANSTLVVVKHPDRPNYNITHAERTDLYRPDWVVMRVAPTRKHGS